MSKIIKLFAFIASLSVAAFSTNAIAVAVIDFQTGAAGAGGTITYADGEVVGENINISLLIVDGAPTGDGSYVADALLAFDTGANTISIDGTVAGLGINTSTTLLSGYFTGWDYSETQFNQVFQGWGVDYKACELLCALGLSGAAWDFFGFSIESANGTVISTDIVNTQVPVPAAVWLFGSGLLGLVGVARRRKA